ncbi:MAG: hypothetical protein WC974_06985 [Thermoplasmata archaeon]
MKNIDKNNEGQLLLMTGVILTFTLITMASISVSIADIGLRTSSEQLQQLLFEFDNINTTFWRAFDVEHYNAIRNYQNSGKMIEDSDIELIFNEILTHMKDIEELRGIRFTATIDPNGVTRHISSNKSQYVGGGGGTPQDTTVYGKIDSNGNIISWTPTPFLSQGLYGSAVVANKTIFYLIGGRNNDDPYIYNNVSYTKQSRDGLLSTGVPTTSLFFPVILSPRAGHAAVIDTTNGRIYVLGGYATSTPQQSTESTVYYANISANGALGDWVLTLPLPTTPPGSGLYKHSAIIYNNKIYVIGGESHGQVFDTVYCGEIDADGSISGWSSSQTDISSFPPLPSPRTAQSAAIAIFNNVPYIYVTGGKDTSGGVPTSTVYYTSIKPDGSLNSWNESATSLLEPICAHGSTIIGNRLYIVGGSDSNGVTSKKVLFTNIISGTTLEAWSSATSLPNAPADLSCWSYNDTSSQIIYVAGGRDNSKEVSTSFHEHYNGSTIRCRFSLSDERSTIARSLTLEFKNQ